MRIELSENAGEIAALLEHPDIIEDITNDGCRNVNMLAGVSALLPVSLYFKVVEDNQIVGIISFHDELEEPAVDIHVAFLERFRGKFAMRAIKETISLLFKYTEYEKIWARFSSNKLSVLKLASALNFKLEYMIEKNYPVHGIIYDTMCMTLTKKDHNHA